MGRLRQSDSVIIGRRNLFRVGRYWFPSVPELHECTVAEPRVVVNHDGHGGTGPHDLRQGRRA